MAPAIARTMVHVTEGAGRGPELRRSPWCRRSACTVRRHVYTRPTALLCYIVGITDGDTLNARCSAAPGGPAQTMRVRLAEVDRLSTTSPSARARASTSRRCTSSDEPELGPRPAIASLSLGEERILVFKHKRLKSLPPVRLRLASGSLLLMKGETQRNWRHGINKEDRPCGPRVNLTFRRIVFSSAAASASPSSPTSP
jgi:hypothetical protein